MNSEAIIKAAIDSDPSATSEQRTAILNALNPKPKKPKVIPITSKEAAGIIGCHVVTLRRYEKAGLIKAIRYTARKIRFDRNGIENFAAEGVQEVAS